MLLLLCLLLLPSFIDASPELLAKNYQFNYSTFNQQKYMEGIMSISLGSQSDLSNLAPTRRLWIMLMTADYEKPTTSAVDCQNRFTALFGQAADVFGKLCKFHYKCEKHELYETEFMQFGSVLRHVIRGEKLRTKTKETIKGKATNWIGKVPEEMGKQVLEVLAEAENKTLVV